MKYLNRLVRWLKTMVWKWSNKSQLKEKARLAKIIAENPDALEMRREERLGCSHENLKKLTEATYQCQNEDCGLIIEILNDRSFKPDMFMLYTKKVQDAMHVKKTKNNEN